MGAPRVGGAHQNSNCPGDTRGLTTILGALGADIYYRRAYSTATQLNGKEAAAPDAAGSKV